MVRRLSEGDRRSMNLGMMGTSGFTVWLTGMSGSGKSTLAQGLANRLRRLGKVVDVLDGPELEQLLNVGGAASKKSATPKPARSAGGGGWGTAAAGSSTRPP